MHPLPKPEEIITAYRAIGYQPESDLWVDHKNKTCCGLGAVVLAQIANEGRFTLGFSSSMIYEVASERFGAEAVKGFVTGFDNCPAMGEPLNADYLAGVAAGRAAREAVIGRKEAARA